MKTLILYATKYGSTRRAAERLATLLGGEAMDICGHAPALADYDAVILGSAVYMGRVMRAMRSFMRTHRDELMRAKLGLFACGGTPAGTDGYMAKLFPDELLGHAKATAQLGGMIQRDRMGLFDRKLIAALEKSGQKLNPQLDEDAMQRFAQAMRG